MLHKWIKILLPISVFVVCRSDVMTEYIEKALKTVKEPELYVRRNKTGFRINLNASFEIQRIVLYGSLNNEEKARNATAADIYDIFYVKQAHWYCLNDAARLKINDTLYFTLAFKFVVGDELKSVSRNYTLRALKYDDAPRFLEGIDIYADVNKQLTEHNYSNAPVFDTFYENRNGWFYINDFIKLTTGDALYFYLVFEASCGVRSVYYKYPFKKEVLRFNTLEDDRRIYVGAHKTNFTS